jgi:hypothetical protein
MSAETDRFIAYSSYVVPGDQESGGRLLLTPAFSSPVYLALGSGKVLELTGQDVPNDDPASLRPENSTRRNYSGWGMYVLKDLTEAGKVTVKEDSSTNDSAVHIERDTKDVKPIAAIQAPFFNGYRDAEETGTSLSFNAMPIGFEITNRGREFVVVTAKIGDVLPAWSPRGMHYADVTKRP